MHILVCNDTLTELRTWPDNTFNCCVTSPPYWGLRDYGVDGQLGLEKTPEEYVHNLTEVFREVKRVLRTDGTLWINLGDTYAANRSYQVTDNKHIDVGNTQAMHASDIGLKPKDLCGIPWRVAFALQADGWWLRSDIIWSKPNPMPESVTDRPTRSHEYIFLLTKSAKYWYDTEAIKEESKYPEDDRKARSNVTDKRMPTEQIAGVRPGSQTYPLRNKRSVWNVATAPFKGAHFATFPPKLIEPCILAGCPVGGIVIDPFGGSMTVGMVCKKHDRDFVGIDLNPKYVQMGEERIERGK